MAGTRTPWTQRLLAAAATAVLSTFLLGTLAASPAAARTTTSRWALGETGADGAPVAWACGTQLVYLYGAPSSAHRRLVVDALRKISAVSGTRFRLGGSTGRSPIDPAGQDKAVVVGFDTFDERYAGYAGRGRDGDRFATGFAVMNLAVDYIAAPTSPSDWDNLTNTVLHELGHVVGLDHVDDSAQVMFGQWNVGRRDYGDGDRDGFRALGCRPAPPKTPTGSSKRVSPSAMTRDGLPALTDTASSAVGLQHI